MGPSSFGVGFVGGAEGFEMSLTYTSEEILEALIAYGLRVESWKMDYGAASFWAVSGAEPGNKRVPADRAVVTDRTRFDAVRKWLLTWGDTRSSGERRLLALQLHWLKDIPDPNPIPETDVPRSWYRRMKALEHRVAMCEDHLKALEDAKQ